MEPTIEVYKMQHQRALECASKIQALCDTVEAAKVNAHEIRMTLANLAGVLKPHLVSEDRLIYPNLKSSDDPAIAQVGAKFSDEMRDISKGVNDFLDTWRKAGAIEQEPEQFVTASTNLFSALAKRIEAEEKELYPLFLSKFSSL